METQDQVLYYIAPDNKIFEEVKQAAIEVWNTYDNTHGYVDEKVDRIKDLGNVEDNVMYIFSMFDTFNQIKVLELLSDEAREAILARLPENYILESLVSWADLEKDLTF